MPELPEVEITRRGLAPAVEGRTLTGVVVRQPALRYPVPTGQLEALVGRCLHRISRRGKYLLFEFADGQVLVHLGMSGSLRLLPAATPAEKHDHVDLSFGDTLVRLRDPRRFGAVLWHGGAAGEHPLLASLGIEPLSETLDGPWLHRASRGRATPIKLLIMDSHVLVGVGNIYASESLFRARIDPRTPAGKLGPARCARLAESIRDTLEAALAAGGSTLRDFIHSDGSSGYFQMQHFVYARAGEACRHCGTPIRSLVMGQRSTFHCPRCQR